MSGSDRSFPALGLTALLATAATVAGAEAGTDARLEAGFTQQSAHEHGKVRLNLAVEGNSLGVEVESPALHVVGFERPPRTAAERTESEGAARWLQSGIGIVGVPAGAGCVLTSAAVTPPEFGKSGGKDHDHDHEHDHDHRHDHGHADDGHGTHADYRVRYQFTCRNPAALAWAEPWLLRRLRGVEQTEVNVIGPAGQRQLTVREPAARIPLR